MSEMLTSGQVVYTTPSHLPCTIECFLGSGGQGEVYRANLNGQPVALKWYFPHYLQYDSGIYDRIHDIIQKGTPSDRFLWPLITVMEPSINGFGYLMPLRDPQYKGIIDLMKRRVEPNFRALATAGFELADSFFQLHAKGLCYRDISFGNIFFEPQDGHVLICDNDNVDVDSREKRGVLGTPRFMAPEIVRGEAAPSRETDLFSLAVLLFYMFMMHHPLEGQKEEQIRCMDAVAMNKLYGSEPIFIFDPQDDSNRPVPGYQQNAIEFWGIYPQFLRDLFTRAFTDGLRSSNSGRIEESEWRRAMIRFRDSILYCPHCGAENFYDVDALQASGGRLNPCWQCYEQIVLPPRMRFGKDVVMLNYDTCLFPHHIDEQQRYDFSTTVATVTQHPSRPEIWGLKNLSADKWVATLADSTVKDVEPGQSLTLTAGTTVNFGKATAEIRH